MIANNLVLEKGLSLLDSRNIGNWIGTKVELQFDDTIRMMGKVVGGIRVKGYKWLPDLEVNTPNFDAVKKALQGGNYTIEQVKTKYNVTDAVAKLLENGK
jgi:hypothetical protein